MRERLRRFLPLALLSLLSASAACGSESEDAPAPAPGPDDTRPEPEPEDPEPEDPEPEEPEARLPPENLQASSDDPLKITLHWKAPADAVAISIERDGEEIATLPGDATSYDDEEALAGTLHAAQFIDLEPALDALRLRWSAPASDPGLEHRYVAIARYEDGTRKASQPVTGRRAALPIESLQLLRDGEPLATLEAGEGEYADETAGTPLLQAPVLEAEGSVAAVTLEWPPAEAMPGKLHTYELATAFADGGTLLSEPQQGARRAPALLGYLLLRDDAELASLDAEARTFTDEDAEAGSIGPPDLQASQGSSAAAVDLAWIMPAGQPGSAHAYRLIARFEAPYEIASPPVEGRREAPAVVEFQLTRDETVLGEWEADATQASDPDARPATLNDAQLQASAGSRPDGVELSWQPYAPIVHRHGYVLHARLDDGSTVSSAVAEGYRAPPALAGYRLTTPGGALELPPEALGALDTSAPAGTLRVEALQASADHVDEVRLEWSQPRATAGESANYTLERRYADGTSQSFEARGHRGAPTLLGFELRRDGAPIASLDPTVLHFTDTEAEAAPPFEIQAFGANQGIAGFTISWRLVPSGTVSEGTRHGYEVVPRTDDGTGLPGTVTGGRAIARTFVHLYRDGAFLVAPTGTQHHTGLSPEELPWLEAPTPVVAEERDGELLLTWGDPVVKGLQRNDYQLVVGTTAGEVRSAVIEAGVQAPEARYLVLYRNGQLHQHFSDPSIRSAMVPAQPGSLSVGLTASEGTVDEGVDLHWTIDAQPGPIERYTLVARYWQMDATDTPPSSPAEGRSLAPTPERIELLRDGAPLLEPALDSRHHRDLSAHRAPTAPPVATASTTFPDKVVLAWDPPEPTVEAHAYRIRVTHSRGTSQSQLVMGHRKPLLLDRFELLRDEALIGTVPADRFQFEDFDAELHGGAPHSLTATGRVDGVQLDWQVQQRIGRSHDYRVEAVYASGERARSPSFSGRKKEPSLTGFEVDRDEDGWMSVGLVDTYLDGEAPSGSLDSIELELSTDPILSYVTLHYANPVWAPSPPSTYRVRALYDHGPPVASEPVVGMRLQSPPSWSNQWQRAIGAGAYEDIAGATGPLFHDLDAPVDETLRYRLLSFANGVPLAHTDAGEVSVPGYRQVSAFAYTTCALRTDGELVCFGVDTSLLDPPEGRFRELSVGSSHACAVRAEDSALECWGEDVAGAATPPEGAFLSVAAGLNATCAIAAADGGVTCWGSPIPYTPPAGPITQLSLHRDRACALLPNDTAHCWGYPSTSLPGSWQQVALGSQYTCALDLDGAVACQGSLVTADVPPGTYLSIHAGYYHACGIREDGTVRCWGDFYQSPISDPPADRRFLQTSGGSTHACGVREDHKIECWGNDFAAAPRRPTP